MAARDESAVDEERERFRTRLHPVVFGGAAGFALFAAVVGALIVLHNDLPPTTNRLVVLGALATAVVGMVPSALRWRWSSVAVTDGRLVARFGLLPVRRVDVPLDAIQDVDVEQTFLGRLLGYGRVYVTARDEGVDTLGPVPAPAELRAALLRGRAGGRRR